MATVTVETFLELHPQFRQASPNAVQAALVAAMNMCSETVFGKHWDLAVRMKAAHLISLEMYGQQEPVEEGKENPYEKEFNQIIRSLPLARMMLT